MRALVISDSHGNIANLRHIMGFAKKYDVSAVIHAGDWNTIDSVKSVLEFGIPLYTVMGNADIDEGMEEFLMFNTKKFNRDFLKIEVDGRKIGLIHKAMTIDKKFESLDIVFSGHYHSKEEKMVDFVKFVRPGAVINGINFAIYETENNSVEFISEEHE
jgi:hypothetical protein